MGIHRTLTSVKIAFWSTHGIFRKKWLRPRCKGRTSISLSKQNITCPLVICLTFSFLWKFLNFSACSFLLPLTNTIPMFSPGNVGFLTLHLWWKEHGTDMERCSLLHVFRRCQAKGINKNTILGIVLWQLITMTILFGFLSS